MTDQQSNIPEKSTQEIPYGYCACGCGQNTTNFRGKPRRFISGHNRQGVIYGVEDGEKHINTCGYVEIKMRSHPKAGKRGYVYEHILVMESILNRYLKANEVVHHIDGDTTNNSPYNLILFSSNKSHLGYHVSLRAFDACGHYDWRLCWICRQYDFMGDLCKCGKESVAHLECRRNYEKNRRDKKKNGTASHP